MRLGKMICLAVGLFCAASVRAQSTNLTLRAISLDECIEMALRNNFDVRIERHNIEQARLDLKMAGTVYDPLMSFYAGRTRNTSLGLESPDIFSTPREKRNYTVIDGMGMEVSGLGPMGFTYRLPVDYTRSFGPPYSYDFLGAGGVEKRQFSEFGGRASLEMKQPLLKDFTIDGARRTLLLSKKLLKMSEFTYQGRIIEVVTLVKLSYYELVFAQAEVKVQEEALRLADKLLDNNRKTFNAGRMAILEVHRAEALVASTKADLLMAKQQVTIQENILKNLITKDLPEWKSVNLIPSDQLLALPQVMDVQESWRTGLIKRPDLAQLRTDLERRDLDIKYRKNQTLPDLSLVGSYGRQAVSQGFEKTFGDLHFRDKAVDYYYGVELSFPWGNRQAKFRLAQEKDQRMQQELVLQQIQQNIMVQIDDSINSAKTSFDRISATRQASEFALKVLQAEESKEGVGMSTPFQILQYQKDLTTARSMEVRALADYNKALALLAQAEGTTLERLKLTLEFK